MDMDSRVLYNMHAHHSPFFFGSSLNLSSSSPTSISPLTTTSSSLPNDTDRYLYLTRHQNQHHGRANLPLFPLPGLSLHPYENKPDPRTGLFTSTTIDAAHHLNHNTTLYPGLNINSTDAVTQVHLDRAPTTTTSMSSTYTTIEPTLAGPHDTSYLAREDPDQHQLQWLYDSIDALLPTVEDDALALPHAVQSTVTLGDGFDVEACIGQMASGFVNIKDVNSYVAESDLAKIAAAFHLAATSEDEGEYSIAVIVDENEVEDGSLPLLLPSPTSDVNYALTGKRRHEDDISEALPFDLDTTPQCYEQDYCHPDKQCANDCTLPKHPRYDDTPSPIPSTKRRRSSTTGSLSSFSRSSSPATSTTSSTDSMLSVGRLPPPRESSNDADVESIDDSEDDDEYVPDPSRPAHFSKKGRNVERACNHCKRSHLRCDEARPCRRCVSAGKADCRDVQHKPRGRPRVVRK